MSIPIKYLPKDLTQKDKKKQLSMLLRSRRMYKKGDYYTRKKVASYKNKPSNHVTTAKKIYKVDSIQPTRELSKKTGCSLSALKKIVNKGEGAYFSSGSRPNQTGQSWGLARLASSITGGKSAAVDFNILKEGCDPKKRAFRLAVSARKKHGYGNRRTVKVVI